MNTKSFMSVIITLAVGVILTVGVLIPVIADNSGNEETNGGYTNTGAYYYKTPVEGETHTIAGVQDGNEIQISYDDEVLYTLTLGEEAWILPIISYINDDSTWGDGHPHIAGYQYFPFPDDSGTSLDNYIFEFDYDLIDKTDSGSSIDFTIQGNKVVKSGTENTCNFYLAPSGEYTYAESPIVENNMEYIICDAFGEYGLQTQSAAAYYRYSSFIGEGIGNEVSDVSIPLSEWHVFVAQGDWPEIESIQYTLDSETVEQGIKLNKVEIEATWEDSESTVTNYELTKFIVPVQIGEDGGSSGSSMSPTLVAMLSVIPLIVVVGLIVGTIGYFIRRE